MAATGKVEDGERGARRKRERQGGELRFISAFSTILPDLEEIRGGGEGRDKKK